MKKLDQTLSSREVAEMVGKQHKNIVRDIRGYLEELGKLKIEPTDFFKESTYLSEQNKELPCYNVTKKGCEFIAHKLTGIKGTEFTAKYINRFHDMEQVIRKEIPQKKKSDTPRRPALSSVNMMVKNVINTLERAKVEPVFIAAEVKRLYTDLGYEVKAPLLADKEDMPKLYDCTEIAKELGMVSSNGKPHNQAVSAIISKLHLEDTEIVKTAFSRNGHEDITTQYKPSVLEEIKLWLAENNYPSKIISNSRVFTVLYEDAA